MSPPKAIQEVGTADGHVLPLHCSALDKDVLLVERQQESNWPGNLTALWLKSNPSVFVKDVDLGLCSVLDESGKLRHIQRIHSQSELPEGLDSRAQACLPRPRPLPPFFPSPLPFPLGAPFAGWELPFPLGCWSGGGCCC